MAKKSKNDMMDDLGSVIQDSVNSLHKNSAGKTVYNLELDADAPTNVLDWVSTGSTVLDFIISNRKNGGLPVGKITEITGLEQSGKSLLAAHVLAETQKKDGIAVFIDTESAVESNFLKAIGVDLSKLLYVPIETIEEIFDTIEQIVDATRKSDKDKLVTIVVDSVAAASTQAEMSTDFQKEGYATAKAILMSKAMRKITNMIARERICLVFTNQLRQKLNAMAFADPYTTSGGKALQFHASVRLRLQQTGAIKGKINGVDEKIGQKTKVKVIKNRLGPPQRECEFEVSYSSGIDDAFGVIQAAKKYGIFKTSGAYTKYVDKETGEEISFQGTEGFNEKIASDPELYDRFYDELAAVLIRDYIKHEGDIEVTDELLEED